MFSVWARWSGPRQHRFLPALTVRVQGVDNTLSGEGRCRLGCWGSITVTYHAAHGGSIFRVSPEGRRPAIGNHHLCELTPSSASAMNSHTVSLDGLKTRKVRKICKSPGRRERRLLRSASICWGE